jgi:hypothetical protein
VPENDIGPRMTETILDSLYGQAACDHVGRAPLAQDPPGDVQEASFSLTFAGPQTSSTLPNLPASY